MYGNSGTYTGNTRFSGGQTYTCHKPTTSMVIKCFKDKSQDADMVYDAQQISDNLREQYKLNQ